MMQNSVCSIFLNTKNREIISKIKDDGFKLTYLGYDFLAIKAMTHRETLFAVGQQIGVGKESGEIFSEIIFLFF